MGPCKHHQRCSVGDPVQTYFSHSSLINYLLFFNLNDKIKLEQQIGGGAINIKSPEAIIMTGQSESLSSS